MAINPMLLVEENTDWALVAAHLAGDEKALGTLMRRYSPRLQRFIERKLGTVLSDDRDEIVKDLLQEVWIRVARHASQGDSQRAKFSSWVYTITSRLVINSGRDRRRWVLRLGMLPYEEKAVESPEAALEARETLERLFDYLEDHTSADNLEVLMMREVEGHTYEEIAKRVGCPLGTVKSRLSRAREAAREFRDQE